MAATPTTRYVRSDDVHIAYQVIGDGPLDLLWVPGYVSHVEATWQSPQHAAFIRRLASFCRLILFDKRGTGMSDRSSQIFTLEQRMMLGYSTIYQGTVKLALWRGGVESVELENAAGLDEVKAEGTPSSAVGEGLADALNVGGF